MTNATTRTIDQLKAGDLVTVNSGFSILGFICWVTLPDGENSFSSWIGYLGLDGEYHERSGLETYTVWLEHPMIGKRRHVEAAALSWAEV